MCFAISFRLAAAFGLILSWFYLFYLFCDRNAPMVVARQKQHRSNNAKPSYHIVKLAVIWRPNK
jgi:hypothetical protein